MFKYRFPAVRGVQANDEYYICMIPLGVLCKLFPIETGDLPPEYRAQRKLNEHRIPEMRDYILHNRDRYVFSALAASVDGIMDFSSESGDVGFLEIDMTSSFLINDGQHRRAAIEEALAEDPSLEQESIPVVLFRDKGLKRSQQMFTDLNKHAVITSKSLNTLYDSDDEAAIISKKVIEAIPFFHKYTDMEKDNLGKFSSNIFTLNTFYTANQKILKGLQGSQEEKYEKILQFWKYVVKNMKEWNEMADGELSKKDLRENYIATQGITLIALGRLGNYLVTHPEQPMETVLSGLKKIDWLRNNTADWLGRAIKTNGQINRNEHGIFATYIQIKRLLGLPVTEEEYNREQM